MTRRLPFMICGITVLAGVWACDSLSDPSNKPPDSGPTIARVSGALVGTDAPSNAHVAVVWRTSEGLVPGADVALVNGRFEMELGAPPSNVLPVGGLSTRTVVGGSTTGLPLREAIAGFLVYADTNGNQHLDLEADAVLGGNEELVLTHFKDGTSFDYEKLRDHTGTLPHEGYNLAWTGGNDGRRWFPLDNIQLQLAASSLPEDVCSGLALTGVCAGNGIPAVADASAGDPPLVGYDASAPPSSITDASIGFDSSSPGSDASAP